MYYYYMQYPTTFTTSVIPKRIPELPDKRFKIQSVMLSLTEIRNIVHIVLNNIELF